MVALAMAVSACGGGGSESSQNDPDPGDPTVREPGGGGETPPEATPQPTPGPTPAVTRRQAGYEARACGFDLNANGIVGEADDCHVCDGSTVDVNGDSVPDRMVYVDCEAGDDDTGNGTPTSPFGTIGRAVNALLPANGNQIQAVCFRNRCSETIRPEISGAAGTYVRDGFEHPRYPLLLSGWDVDDDGEYPPFDDDEQSVLIGDGLDFAIVNDQAESYLEFAHFSAVNYGDGCDDEIGFMRPALGGPAVSHISVHDLELYDINPRCAPSSGRSVFLTFVEGSVLSHFAIINTLVDRYGGYAIRGSGVGSDILGPYRFQNMTIRPRGPEGGFAHGLKLWDYIERVELLDNVFDADPEPWSPCPSRLDVDACEPTFAISAAQCSRDWLIRGNEFYDWKLAIGIQPDAGPEFCQDRDMDGIVIDANIIRNDYSPWRLGDVAIRLEAGDSTTVQDVSITNNFISTSSGWEACIWSSVGRETGEQSGTIRIVGNTCHGITNRYGSLTIGMPQNEGDEPSRPQHSYDVRNNIFSAVGEVNVATTYAVQNLVADGNVYDRNAGFGWAERRAGEIRQGSLTEWQGASGEGAQSQVCTPAYADEASGDLHIRTNDECARNAAVDAADVVTTDFDGQPRQGVPSADVGADEVFE